MNPNTSTPSTPVSNGLALSRMIQTSAKSKGALIRLCPITDNPVVTIHFPSLKAASHFHEAFSLFSAAAKRAAKRVRAKEREQRASRAAAQKDCEKSYLYGRSP